MARKISVSGWIAWREGATLDDNPFDEKTQYSQWRGWIVEFQNADKYSRKEKADGYT